MSRFDRYLHYLLVTGTLFFGASAVLVAWSGEYAQAAFLMATAVWVDPT